MFRSVGVQASLLEGVLPVELLRQALRRARARAKAQKGGGEHDAHAGRRRGRLARAVNELTELLGATRQIAAQTRHRLAGQTPHGSTRRVSLHDPHARPIAKGRLGKPLEFGQRLNWSKAMTV